MRTSFDVIEESPLTKLRTTLVQTQNSIQERKTLLQRQGGTSIGLKADICAYGCTEAYLIKEIEKYERLNGEGK